MNRTFFINLAAAILLFIALAMVIIAFQIKAIAPGLTALGFIFIAMVFFVLNASNKSRNT